MHCRDGHSYIVVETEGDANGWRAHLLCCSRCLQLIYFKDVLKASKQKQISAEIINNN